MNRALFFKQCLTNAWLLLLTVVGGAVLLALLLGAIFFAFPVVVLFGVVLGGDMVNRLRRRRVQMMLQYVYQAVRLNLPLPTVLTAARLGEHGLLAQRLGMLCDYLEGGMPVGAAMAAASPDMSPRQIALTASADRIGRLDASLQRLVEHEAQQLRSQQAVGGLLWIYPTFVTLIALTVVGLLSVFVAPKFAMIFQDFEMELPAITAQVLGTTDVIGPTMLVLGGLVLLAVCGWSLGMMSADFRKMATPLWVVFDTLAWYAPVARRAALDRAMADVCHTISEALRAGLSMTSALNEAAMLHMNRFMARRIRRWADYTEQGMLPHEAARAARLPHLVSGLLATARSGDDGPRVFDLLGRYYTGRVSRTMILLRAAVVPAAALLLGLLVGWIVIGLMLPMARLIEGVSIETGLM